MDDQSFEDLLAFERRLRELLNSYRPSMWRWRIVLAVAFLCTAISAWYWLQDPKTSHVSLRQSLCNHRFFTFSLIALILLFIYGVQYLVIAPKIMMNRSREIMAQYQLDCDNEGRLILLSPQQRTQFNTLHQN